MLDLTHWSPDKMAAIFQMAFSNSPHKWPVTRKMFPFDDVIMDLLRRFTGIRHHESSTREGYQWCGHKSSNKNKEHLRANGVRNSRNVLCNLLANTLLNVIWNANRGLTSKLLKGIFLERETLSSIVCQHGCKNFYRAFFRQLHNSGKIHQLYLLIS